MGMIFIPCYKGLCSIFLSSRKKLKNKNIISIRREVKVLNKKDILKYCLLGGAGQQERYIITDNSDL